MRVGVGRLRIGQVALDKGSAGQTRELRSSSIRIFSLTSRSCAFLVGGGERETNKCVKRQGEAKLFPNIFRLEHQHLSNLRASDLLPVAMHRCKQLSLPLPTQK